MYQSLIAKYVFIPNQIKITKTGICYKKDKIIKQIPKSLKTLKMHFSPSIEKKWNFQLILNYTTGNDNPLDTVFPYFVCRREHWLS